MPLSRHTLAFAVCLSASSIASAADPWTLVEVLTPPAEAGYQAYESLGFGKAVAMSDQWLAVSIDNGRCDSSGTSPRGTVAMYRYDELSGSYDYRYQLCGTGSVWCLAFWNDWLVLGVPGRDGVPGDSGTSGVLDFYKLGTDGEQWNRLQTVAGSDNSQIGRAIAISGGVAVAGDWTYNDRRGRILSWRLDSAGTQWSAETTLLPPGPPLMPRIQPNERFGEYVALDVRGCLAPTCTAPLDALLVQSRSGLHSYERTAAGWGSRTMIAPSRGTQSGSMQLSMNAFVAVAGASVLLNDPSAPCAGQGYEAVRVLERVRGSASLRSLAFACPGQLGIDSMAMTPTRSAVTGVKSEFVLSMPDVPAIQVGTASTWNVFGNPVRAQPTDFVVDLNRTPEAYAATGYPHFHPEFAGDYFGAGLAVTASRLAVGATFKESFWGIFGDGYVAIYSR